MKRIIVLFIVLMSASIALFAQKREVTSAWSFLKDGFLDDAKKSIEKAEKNNETREWYKTYYYKGQIYHEIGNSTKPKYKALCTNCYDTAFVAYLKSIRLNFVKPEHRSIDLNTEEGFLKFVSVIRENNERNYESTEQLYDVLMNRFPALSNGFIHLGLEKYGKNEFEAAYTNFEKAIQIATLGFKADTQLYYVTSLAAMKCKKWKEALPLFDVLIQLNFGNNPEEKIYPYASKAESQLKLGDTVKMLKTIEDGIKKFPDNNYQLIIQAFNYYVNIGNNAKALEYINKAIEKNDKESSFFVIRGTLSESMGKKQQAIKDYEKALNMQVDNFDANHAMGAYYYNSAVDTIKWAEDNIPITNFKEAEAYQNISKELFLKSVPFLEKCHAQQPKDINVISTLKTIYYRLQNMEKYKEFNEKYIELAK